MIPNADIATSWCYDAGPCLFNGSGQKETETKEEEMPIPLFHAILDTLRDHVDAFRAVNQTIRLWHQELDRRRANRKL